MRRTQASGTFKDSNDLNGILEVHMVALLVALLFTTAIAVSLWAMFVTIQPRLAYMRTLLIGDTVPALAPAAAPRVRVSSRPVAVSALGTQPLRAAA